MTTTWPAGLVRPVLIDMEPKMVDFHVRAMTWNLWWRFGPRWRERQPGILATIQRFTPDVVGLQEVWRTTERTQADELAEALGFYPTFAAPSYPAAPDPPVAPDHAGVELGVALLSRWPIVQRDVITMPARHRAWDPVILKVAVAHPAGPLPVLVACLEHATTYSDDRLAQASMLADLPLTGPSLAMGDLNAAPDSSVLRPLRDVLIDAWQAGGGAPDAVTLPSTHPSAPLEAGPDLVDQRIDHVFYRPGHEGSAGQRESVVVGGDAVDGVFPSNHRAVVVNLRWHDR